MESLIVNEFEDYGNEFLRNVNVDNVILGYHDKELKVLLQQPFAGGKWTVTGGYIKRTESIEEAADRIAFNRTGLKDLFFQQFRSFGNPGRTVENGITPAQLGQAATSWIFDYFVSVGFYTLTEFSLVDLKKAAHEANCQWWAISSLPPLMFDHELMIAEALKALRLHISHYPIGYELLPAKFTLPEIHSLYETILGRALDSRNFGKRLIATGILEKLNETKSIGAHRSPFLYRFINQRYTEALATGISLAF